MSLAGTVAGAAKRALGTYGAPGTLSHAEDGAYNPTTGATTTTTTTVSVRALLDGSSTTALGFKFGPDLVQAGDLKATIANAVPYVGDRLSLAAGIFTVVAVRPSYVVGTAVMWECLVRR